MVSHKDCAVNYICACCSNLKVKLCDRIILSGTLYAMISKTLDAIMMITFILMNNCIVIVLQNFIPDIAKDIAFVKMNAKYYSLAHVGLLLDHCPSTPQVLKAAPSRMYPSSHSYSAVL